MGAAWQRHGMCELALTVQTMSPLIRLLIPYSVSKENLKIKLANDKVINDKLSAVEIKTFNFFRI
jgi:hypothetical protein